jgi:hypothetical protein
MYVIPRSVSRKDLGYKSSYVGEHHYTKASKHGVCLGGEMVKQGTYQKGKKTLKASTALVRNQDPLLPRTAPTGCWPCVPGHDPVLVRFNWLHSLHDLAWS